VDERCWNVGFSTDEPFCPVPIRGFYVDGDAVIVIWDGAGTIVAGTSYENTYAWILTVNNGQVVDGTAFDDGIRSMNSGRSIPSAPNPSSR
jgi:uncharacterized protein